MQSDRVLPTLPRIDEIFACLISLDLVCTCHGKADDCQAHTYAVCCDKNGVWRLEDVSGWMTRSTANCGQEILIVIKNRFGRTSACCWSSL